MRNELAETLTQLIDSVNAPAPPGIVITAAEIEFPLEVIPALRSGALIFYGSAAHSRWKAGVLPDVHMARLRVEAVEEAEA